MVVGVLVWSLAGPLGTGYSNGSLLPIWCVLFRFSCNYFCFLNFKIFSPNGIISPTTIIIVNY